MNFKEKKKKLLEWHDFYGQDIGDTDRIKKSKCSRDLKEILKEHRFFLETQNIDAMTHLNLFEKKLGL